MLDADTLELRGLAIRCHLGVLPVERRRPQPVVVDVALGIAADPAAQSGDLERTVDYARLSRELVFVLTAARFRLMESAAVALVHVVLSAAGPAARWAAVTVRKPTALGRSGGVPGITVRRTAADAHRAERGTGRGAATAAGVRNVYVCADAVIGRRGATSGAPRRQSGDGDELRHADGSGIVVRRSGEARAADAAAARPSAAARSRRARGPVGARKG